MQPLISQSIHDPGVIENPYPFYNTLQAEAPVYQVPGTIVYLVSSWQLIHQVLSNQQDYSANLTGILITGENGDLELFDFTQFGGTVNAIANADEPFHAVHRKLVLPQLNARKVALLEDEVREWARRGVQKLVKRGEGDCVTDLANAIPVMVMARLTGLPVQDVDRLLGWAFSGGDILAGTCDLQQLLELSVSTGELSTYLKHHFELAVKRRGQAEPANVLDELAQGVHEGLISEQDAVSIVIVLVGAAGESTSSLIGSAIRILAQNQGLQQELRSSPERSGTFLEEVVRLESPFKGHYREVLKQTQLGGIALPKNARVFLLWAAANRDPSVFANPDTLDLDRADGKDHLGFGYGIHFCIGARLARMEGKIVLEELLQATSSFSIHSQHAIKHVPSIFVRRMAQLFLSVKE